MKRLETKYIEIGEEKLPFRFSFNAFMYYYEMFGKQFTQLKTTKDLVEISYCAYKGGCNYEKIPVNIISIEDFERLIEEFPYCLEELSNTIQEQFLYKKK